MKWIPKSVLILGLMLFQIPASYAQANLYTDPFGNTMGRIGDDRVNTYRDSFGNTTGTIGNNRVNTYTDTFGNTTGTIGGRSP